MKARVVGTLVLVTAVVMAAGPGPADRAQALASLIDAERSFSALSEAKGIREAFLAWLAPDAVVFRPGPVPGRPVYEKMDPANPAVLTWEPEVAEVAASGELGYTSGPYRLKPARDREPAAFGRYVSVWTKQLDGTWKVLIDAGVAHDPPASSAPVGAVAAPAPGLAREPLSIAALRDEEYAFGERAGTFIEVAGRRGLRKALIAAASDDVRVLRPGRLPAVGKAAVKDLIPAAAGKVIRGSPERRSSYEVVVAWSGDLACCYGTLELWEDKTASKTSAYLRIWRKDEAGAWKLCLDVEVPVSPS
jgi:ketosteroid isomerase-like protein